MESDYLKLLNAFTGTDEYRADYRRPFSYKGYAVATDGRKIIKIPVHNFSFDQNLSFPDPEISEKELDRVWGIFNNHQKEIGYLDFTSQLQLPTEPVYGVKMDECDNCGGTGECTCFDCGYEHTCGECDGTGEIEVKDTKTVIGEKVTSNAYIKIEDTFFDPALINTVAINFPHKIKVLALTRETILLNSGEADIIIAAKIKGEEKEIIELEIIK